MPARETLVSKTAVQKRKTEEGDDKKHSPEEVSLPEKETTRFFFFSKNDDRLHGSDFSGEEWEVILAGTLGKSEQTIKYGLSKET